MTKKIMTDKNMIEKNKTEKNKTEKNMIEKNKIENRPTEKEINRLIKRYRSGDEQAAGELISVLRPLVKALAWRNRNPWHDHEDLEQVGLVGLWKAIERFDPGVGARLTTYAVPWIYGEMRTYISRGHGLIKANLNMGKAAREAVVGREEVAGKVGVGKEEVAGKSGVEDVTRKMGVGKAAREAGISVEEAAVSTEYPFLIVFPGTGDMNSIPSEEVLDEQVSMNIWLKDALKTLDVTGRKVIFYRYFRGYTQQEIADLMGMTQKQVSRLEKKILQQMKAALRNTDETSKKLS